MKKYFILSAMALGLMSSCSENENLHSSSYNANSIVFSTQANKSLTRSGQTINTISQFTVNAFNNDGVAFFNNEKFVYDESYEVFKSEMTHYWPATGSLSFYAINSPGEYSISTNKVPQYTYNNWKGEEDLVAATVVSGSKQIPYPLVFKHLTSQIYVNAEAENKTEDLTYKLVSIKMKAPSNGTYSFANQTGGTGTWEIDNNSLSEYSYNKGLPITFSQNDHAELSEPYWNILPTKDGTLLFKIEYQVLQHDKVISDLTGNNAKTCIVENPNLIPGKRYIFNFLLARQTNDEITFSLSVADWNEESKIDLNPATLPNVITLSSTKIIVEQKSKKLLYVASVIPAEASKDVTWVSADPDIATVDAETGVVKGINVGITSVTATTRNGISKTCEVEVVEHDSYNGYDFVDLGLPSGLKWATMNVGASSIEETGYYFAWGETEGHCLNKVHDYRFNSANYTMEDWVGDIDLAHDAARVNMGGDWRMPSHQEIEELCRYTTHDTDFVNGVEGVRYTSQKNPDNSIFLPETGYWNDQYDYDLERKHVGIGRYWSISRNSSRPELGNTFESHDHIALNNNSYYRYNGLCVRAVCE